jgi:hypothetical protein
VPALGGTCLDAPTALIDDHFVSCPVRLIDFAFPQPAGC